MRFLLIAACLAAATPSLAGEGLPWNVLSREGVDRAPMPGTASRTADDAARLSRRDPAETWRWPAAWAYEPAARGRRIWEMRRVVAMLGE